MAALGRPQYINIRKEPAVKFELESFKELGKEVLETAYKSGIRYYDTAPGYGLAEQLLLDWVKEKNDPEIEVATKWGYVYVANFDANAKVHEIKDHGLQNLSQQWQFSQRLLPQLSTLQIHSATFETGVLENKAVLEKLLQLKHDHTLKIGLTTTGDNQVEVLKHALDVELNGEALFDVFQVTYNLLDQSLGSMKNQLNKLGKRVVIKEALANGRILPNQNYPGYAPLYKALQRISQKYNAGVDAVALRFCLQTIQPFMLLSGASKTYQLVENLKVTTFELTDEELNELSQFKVTPQFYWSERKLLPWN